MSVHLNHTIVYSADKTASARWFADIVGLRLQPQYGPFLPVETGNGVTLDFMDAPLPIAPQHYAFLVSEDDFDSIMARIEAAGVAFYADRAHRQAGRINRNDNGRGAYFDDPSGHVLEIITVPYGGATILDRAGHEDLTNEA